MSSRATSSITGNNGSPREVPGRDEVGMIFLAEGGRDLAEGGRLEGDGGSWGLGVNWVFCGGYMRVRVGVRGRVTVGVGVMGRVRVRGRGIVK